MRVIAKFGGIIFNRELSLVCKIVVLKNVPETIKRKINIDIKNNIKFPILK
jgi:hypothetical protein